MQLLTQMFEDPRGKRSTMATLYLHRTANVPVDSKDWSTKARTQMDPESRAPSVANRVVAELDLLAPDSLDENGLNDALSGGLRDALLNSVSVWAQTEVIAARYLRADRFIHEQDTILAALLDSARTRLRRRRLMTSLRIRRLDLIDYRGIEQMSVDFAPSQTTLLVGVNGAGKTTVLDAAALMLSHLAAGIAKPGDWLRPFSDNDIMNGRASARVGMTVDVRGSEHTWSLKHVRGESWREFLNELVPNTAYAPVLQVIEDLSRGDVCLPVMVYYPVYRAVRDVRIQPTNQTMGPMDALDGIVASSQLDFRSFFEWFRNREDFENEYRIRDSAYRDHQLEAVRNAVSSLMPDFKELRVQRVPLAMMVGKGDWTLTIDQLSGGERNLLALVGDLARRLAMANPYLDNPLEGGGVVLIDEIELHLHPGWQRAIIPALERTFPHCQFIITTHSPTVLGHVDRDSVFVLVPDGLNISATHPRMSRGLDANRVLLELMGVDERPTDIKQRIEQIYSLLGGGKLAEARTEIAVLEGEIGSDPELTKAETIIRRKEILGK